MRKNIGDFELGVSGVLWLGLNTGSIYVMQLIITFFLARLLTPAEFGEIATITILIGFADLFWQFGVGPALIQKNDINEEDIKTAHTITIIFGLLVFTFINCFAQFWINIFNIADILMLRVYSSVFLINSLATISQSLNQKNFKFKLISIVTGGAVIIYGVSAIFFALKGLGVWSLVWAALIKAAFQCIAFNISQPVSLKFQIHSKSARELMQFGGGYTMARFFNYIALNGDNYLTSIMLGKGSTGLGSYSRAYQLLLYPVQLLGETIDQVLFPLLSQSQNNLEKIKKVFLNGLGTILLLSIPTSVIAFIRASDLVNFILGSQWNNVVLPFKIMVTCLFFRIAYKLGESILRSVGRVYYISKMQIIYAFLVIIGAYIGTYYGISGVAVGATVAFTVNCIIITSAVLGMLRIKISELMSYLIPVFLFGLITILFIIPYEKLICIPNPFLACVAFTLYVFLIYILTYLLIGKRILNNDLHIFINDISTDMLNKLRRKS